VVVQHSAPSERRCVRVELMLGGRPPDLPTQVVFGTAGGASQSDAAAAAAEGTTGAAAGAATTGAGAGAAAGAAPTAAGGTSWAGESWRTAAGTDGERATERSASGKDKSTEMAAGFKPAGTKAAEAAVADAAVSAVCRSRREASYAALSRAEFPRKSWIARAVERSGFVGTAAVPTGEPPGCPSTASSGTPTAPPVLRNTFWPLTGSGAPGVCPP
jgi:hypothetical protein